MMHSTAALICITLQGGKWTFGPIWDSEWTWEPDVRKGPFWEERERYHGGSGEKLPLPTWIAELWKYNKFRRIVLKEWEKFYPDYLDKVRAFVDGFYAQTRAAYEVNGKIWPSYDVVNIDWAYSRVTTHLESYAAWFDQFIREAVNGVEGIAADTVAYPADVYTATGILVRHAAAADEVAALPSGLYCTSWVAANLSYDKKDSRSGSVRTLPLGRRVLFCHKEVLGAILLLPLHRITE